jgi:hypothetical protein
MPSDRHLPSAWIFCLSEHDTKASSSAVPGSSREACRDGRAVSSDVVLEN